MKRIRVVHYNHTEVVSGAERVLLSLLPRLVNHGFESILLSPAGQLQEEAQGLGIKVASCHSLQARFTSNPWKLAQYLRSFVLSIRNIRRKLNDLGPDVVHANSVRAGLVMTVATIGLDTPIIWHVHDALPSHPFSPVIRMVAALSRRTSSVVVSRSTARIFSRGLFHRIISRKTEVLHNAVELKPNLSTAQERTQLRDALAVGDRFLIGCVGQVCLRKGQIALVEIFAEALKSNPEMALIIVGSALFAADKPYEERLHQRIGELGIGESVRMLGRRNDVPLLLQAMDVLVLPSVHDPFPMVLLESMAAALPIVAYSVDGVPELIDDGKTGWLVPPGDRSQMVRAILAAEGNPDQRQRLAEAARQVVHKHTLSNYAGTFAEILRGRVTQSDRNQCVTDEAGHESHAKSGVA
ncbi:MAG: glycosyltransferase family 4 protein [Terracidiphilus sp.]